MVSKLRIVTVTVSLLSLTIYDRFVFGFVSIWLCFYLALFLFGFVSIWLCFYLAVFLFGGVLLEDKEMIRY